MRYQWILFDADGTLFDFDLAEQTALRRSFELADYPFATDTIASMIASTRLPGRRWNEARSWRLISTVFAFPNCSPRRASPETRRRLAQPICNSLPLAPT